MTSKNSAFQNSIYNHIAKFANIQYANEILVKLSYYFYVKSGYWKDIELKSMIFSGINAVSSGLCQIYSNGVFEYRINEVI